MSRPRKGPRLYLRDRAGRAAVYVILDGAREIGTGCGPERAAEAEKALADYLAAKYTPPATKGAQAGFSLADILIADVMTAYLSEHAAHTASAAFIAHTAKPILDWWGTRTLADVKGQACRDYVAWRTAQRVRNSDRPVTPATARHDLKTLRAAIHHWHKEHGPLPAVPAVTLPPAPPPRERWLTRAEAAAMLWHARRVRQCGHVARVLLIGAYTGTRSKALLRLKWLPSTDGGWIDLEGGVIHRAAQGARQTKKRQTPARIPPRLLPHLRRWRAADLARGVVHVIHYGGGPVAKLRRSWERVRDAAGLGADVVPHILRHTAATWLMQSGCPKYEAAGFLGMSEQMLEEVYGHHHPEFQSAAANAARGRRPERTGPSAQGMARKPSSIAVAERHGTAANVRKLHDKR